MNFVFSKRLKINNTNKQRHIKSVRKQFELQQKFLEISDTMPIMVVEMDTELKFTYIDSHVEGYFGYSNDEVQGKYVPDFFHPDDRDRMAENGHKLFTGGSTAPREYRIIKKNGIPFTVLISALPLFKDEMPSGIRAFTLDISEYKRISQGKIDQLEREKAEAYRLVDELKEEMREKYRFGDMISKDHKMLKIIETVKIVASVPSSVLITGENGCGKELIAKQLHYAGNRKSAPFIAVNSGALPENLLETELFGYTAGSFTGANRDKKGKFELVQGGTLFLDEIGDMPLALQVKLLRVLQERTITPIGGTEEIPIDVRLVVATNKDLEGMVENGMFREDLYYRIKVVKIELPALRKRYGDIPLLCDYFVNHYATLFGKKITALSTEVLRTLMTYTFPGNIRELQNIIEHASIFCDGTSIEMDHLPEDLVSSIAKRAAPNEKEQIISAIKSTKNNKTAAAEELGMHKATLFRKIKKYNITEYDVI